MKKFTWKSFIAIGISLYPFIYRQIDRQHRIATDIADLPYEPIWFLLYFLVPFISILISIFGLTQQEENPWLFRISLIISVITIISFIPILF